MLKKLAFLLPVLFLAACSGFNLPLNLSTPIFQPTQPPRIFSPTPSYNPTATPVIFTPTVTSTSTFTLTQTIISTSTASALIVEVAGCDTSLDITHGMGEVTNAYPLIQNRTGQALTDLCATLSASDEDRFHPDKTVCISLLPSGDQVILKLTVDTGFKQDTSIQVDLTSSQGISASVSRPSCQDIGLPGFVPVKVGLVEPIP